MEKNQFHKKDLALIELETFLSKNSFLSGTDSPGQKDSNMINAMKVEFNWQNPPNSNKYPNCFGWYWSLSVFSQNTRKLWNALNINPDLSDNEFQEEGNTIEFLDENEKKTNNSCFSEKNSLISKEICAQEDKQLEFENFSEHNSNRMISDKNLILSHISKPKCSSSQSNSHDCHSIVSQLEQEIQSTKTSERNLKENKNGNQNGTFKLDKKEIQGNPSFSFDGDRISSTYTEKSGKKNIGNIKILKTKFTENEDDFKITFLEHNLDISKFEGKKQKNMFDTKSVKSDKKIRIKDLDDDESTEIVRVASLCNNSSTSQLNNSINKKIGSNLNYNYSFDHSKDIKKLNNILVSNSLLKEKNFNGNKLKNENVMNTQADIEDKKSEENEVFNNSTSLNENKTPESNEKAKTEKMSFSFKSFKN